VSYLLLVFGPADITHSGQVSVPLRALVPTGELEDLFEESGVVQVAVALVDGGGDERL
jgi:hypothetical protein